jgi:hypothetical protein
LVRAGGDRHLFIKQLDALRGSPTNEEVLLDVMDCLAGWCAPHMAI